MFEERASQDTLDWFFNWYDDLHGTYQIDAPTMLKHRGFS